MNTTNLMKLAFTATVTCALSSIAHAGTISISMNGPVGPLFDIKLNQFHGKMTSNGYKQQNDSAPAENPPIPSYGAWFDSPVNPYKYGADVYFQVASAQSFRLKLPPNPPHGHWADRSKWQLQPGTPSGATITPAQQDPDQSHYNMSNWIFSPYVQYPNIYGLTHHEWYPPGQLAWKSTYLTGYFPPVWGIGWISSTDGGATWAMKPVNNNLPSNANRMVLIPEPWNTTYQGKHYGFAHPSNIVKEGSYYYVFVTSLQRKGATDAIGVSMIRTTNLTSPTGWQYWGGSSWVTISQNTYQGNNGPQQPYIFWQGTTDCPSLYATNVRKHAASGKWIIFGSEYCQPQAGFNQATFATLDSLANPSSLDRNGQDIRPNWVDQKGNNLPSNIYFSFFDISGESYVGDNFEVVNDKPLFVLVDSGRDSISHQFLTITYTP